MKKSRYNHFFPYLETHHIAYNAMSNALALLDNEKYILYQGFCNGKATLPDELADDLKKGLFILDDSVDELEVLRFRMLQTRFNTDSLSFTIVPTNDCNFRCSYCFEKDVLKNTYMSQEVQDKIVGLLDDRKHLIASFSVSWFGGEPLMNFDTVESLSHRFMKICEENDITYRASIITNGYLLTHDVIARMKDLGIAYIQVTVDGLPELHDKKRPLADGSGTFDTIMNNLKDGKDLLPPIALRINIDKNNLTSGENIYRFLQENDLLTKVTPHYGMIANYTAANNEPDCLNVCDFSEISYDYDMQNNAEKSAMSHYPTQKGSFCGADSLSYYAFDAEGYIYKCWCDIGDATRQVGNVSDGNFNLSNELYLKYMMLDPTAVEPCKSCDVLPICMGGCPYKRIEKITDKCSNHKFILEKTLQNATRAMVNARAASENTCIEPAN